MKLKLIILTFGLWLGLSGPLLAEDIVLKDSHPGSYVIKKGDTLWDISSRFLRDPWRWPDIWYVNPQIRNPHLIYPGDEVVLTFKDGKPRLELRRGKDNGLRVIKLGPEVRKEQLKRPIPTIPVSAIQQFLTRPQVMSEGQYEQLPYVVSTQDARLAAGTHEKIYIRGIVPGGETRYTIIRKGQDYHDSKRNGGKYLGMEALYIGEAVVTQFGDPTSVEVTHASREILVGDRLVPATAEQLDYSFQPKAPSQRVRGQIIAVVDGVSHIGQYQVVVINKGRKDGIEKGHVLAVYRSGIEVRDTVKSGMMGNTVILPDELNGHLMVFRTFENLSYALVMKATRDMGVYDLVVNP